MMNNASAQRAASPARLSRRQALGASALAAGALAAWPLTAFASDKQDGAPVDTADAAAPAAGSDAAVTPLNEVAYPEPIPSGDYDKLFAVEEDNPLDEDFLMALSTFANNLASYGFAGASAEDAAPNVCLSPASLYLALGLLAQGAAGDTQVQLLDALGMGDAGAQVLAEQCGNLMRTLWARTTPEGDEMPSTLQVANSVWMLNDVPFEQTFLDTAASSFYAECFGVAKADEAAGKAMGAWIAEHTGGALEPTLELNDSWIASLINTVWFKDGWTDPFNENDTAPGLFHAAAGDVECEFMTQTRECTVGEAGGCRVASLPLATGARVSFLLPDDEETDVRSLFARATGVGKMWMADHTSSELVEATFVVPKVSFDAKTQLAEVCKQLGVVDAFGDAADLSALTSAPAQVSTVEQGTHFALNECGVEASAYTVIAIAKAALMPQDLRKVEFRLDRPFAFRLTDPHGIVLFDGIVGDPTQA